MHYFSNKFSKIAQRLLSLDFSDLKLHDLVKMWFFKLIMTKSSLKKISHDVISLTSLLLRHQTNILKFFHFASQPSKIFGYASDEIDFRIHVS